MALRNAFCPNCGSPTQINDTKEFCFCLSCGNKIMVPRRELPVVEPDATVSSHEPRQRAQAMIENEQIKQVDVPSQDGNTAPAEKMKEAEFYYSLSREKKEYADVNAEPSYYLKGQDILVNLSQQFPLDYHVWWELCKPMDFAVILEGEVSCCPNVINRTYFDKALDLAPLEKKMDLIRQHDKYSEVKERVLKEQEEKQLALEEEEQRKQKIAEEQRRQAEIERQEKERIESEQRRQAEIERQEKERIESEQRAAEFTQVRQEKSVSVWSSLKEKDYKAVDNSYFQFKSPEGDLIIATLKVVANVLYLSAFHEDARKKNTIYMDQSIAIHFNESGVAMTFDNKPIVVRGWNSLQNRICVMANPNGGCMVNDFVLVQDQEYVASISKAAKKPLVSFKKLFG